MFTVTRTDIQISIFPLEAILLNTDTLLHAKQMSMLTSNATALASHGKCDATSTVTCLQCLSASPRQLLYLNGDTRTTRGKLLHRRASS